MKKWVLRIALLGILMAIVGILLWCLLIFDIGEVKSMLSAMIVAGFIYEVYVFCMIVYDFIIRKNKM